MLKSFLLTTVTIFIKKEVSYSILSTYILLWYILVQYFAWSGHTRSLYLGLTKGLFPIYE